MSALNKFKLLRFSDPTKKEVIECRYCGTTLFVRIFTDGINKFGICFHCFQRALDRILDYQNPAE